MVTKDISTQTKPNQKFKKRALPFISSAIALLVALGIFSHLGSSSQNQSVTTFAEVENTSYTKTSESLETSQIDNKPTKSTFDIAPEIRSATNLNKSTPVSDEAIATTPFIADSYVVELDTQDIDEASSILSSILGYTPAVEYIGGSAFSVTSGAENSIDKPTTLDTLDESSLQKLISLNESDRVLSAEPNIIYTHFQDDQDGTDDGENESISEASTRSSEPFQADQWYLENQGQSIFIGEEEFIGIDDKDIDFEESQDQLTSAEQTRDIVVAVTDDGVDITHPDLVDSILREEDGTIVGYDFVADGIYENPEYTYGWGHGTHIAGVIAAQQNGSGITGICSNCKIMPVQIFGPFGATNVDSIKSIYYAVANGADVINASWGSAYPSEALKNAVDYATEQGVVFVAAAGNSGDDGLFYPASFDSAVSVAALDNQGQPATFTTYNEYVDISAPGENILSTLPSGADLYEDGVEEGQPNKCEDRNYGESSDGYGYCSGTSMASPVVAGVIAQLLYHDPSAGLYDTQSRIIEGSEAISEVQDNQQNLLGSGAVNINNALNVQPKIVLEKPEFQFSDELGNNNTLNEGGEIITARVSILNMWNTLPESTATLSSNDPNVFMLQSEQQFESIEAGQRADYVFTIGVNNYLTRGHSVPMTFVITADGVEYEYSTELLIEVIYQDQASWSFDEGPEDWRSQGTFNWNRDCESDSAGESIGFWHSSTEGCQGYQSNASGTLTSPVVRFTESSESLRYIELVHRLDQEKVGFTDPITYPDSAQVKFKEFGQEYSYLSNMILRDNNCGSDYTPQLCNTDGFVTERLYLPNLYNIEDRMFQFVLSFTSDSSISADGWYIDEIRFGSMANEQPVVTQQEPIIIPSTKENYSFNVYDYITIEDDLSDSFRTTFSYYPDYPLSIAKSNSQTGDFTISSSEVFTGKRYLRLMVEESLPGSATTQFELEFQMPLVDASNEIVIEQPNVEVVLDSVEDLKIAVSLPETAGISVGDEEASVLTFSPTLAEGFDSLFLSRDGTLYGRVSSNIERATVQYEVSSTGLQSRQGAILFINQIEQLINDEQDLDDSESNQNDTALTPPSLTDSSNTNAHDVVD